MNIDLIKQKHNNLWVIEFYDNYQGGFIPIFRLSGEYKYKKDADYMARKLNLLFNKVKNEK